MKRALFAAATAMALCAAPVIAQTASLTPEQRSKIKRYVIEEKNAPVTITGRVTVGEKLPASVELSPVPDNWGSAITKFRYVLTPVPTGWGPSITKYSYPLENQIVLVEPSTREVVAIVAK